MQSCYTEKRTLASAYLIVRQPRIKKAPLRKRISTAVVCVLSLSVWPFAAVAAQGVSPQITVGATGEATMTPTRASVVIGVQTDDTTAAGASSQNVRILETVMSSLSVLGIGADSITQTAVRVEPKRDYQGDAQQIVGYKATTTISVPVSDLTAVGGVIDAVLAAGATDIRQVEFDADSRENATRGALEMAVRTARLEAEILASAAGTNLGDIVSIEYPVRSDQAAISFSARSSGFVGFAAPDLTITTTVSITWALLIQP